MAEEKDVSIEYKVILPLGYERKADILMAPTFEVIAEQDHLNQIYILKSAQRAFEKTALENYQG